jgi:hypothetical protein
VGLMWDFSSRFLKDLYRLLLSFSDGMEINFSRGPVFMPQQSLD